MRNLLNLSLIKAALFLAVISLHFAGHAQTARFYGHVTDDQGAVIPDATVSITDLAKGSTVQAKTDGEGAYSVNFLTATNYHIDVHVQGFDSYTKDVTLGMGQALDLEIQLTVGKEVTTVNVQENSELTTLHTDTAEITDTVTGEEVHKIQLNGRNFTQLTALAPGVSNQTGQDEAKVGMAGSVAFSVNGGRTEYNSWSVDGSEVLNVGINKDHSTLIVYPSIDAIQEIKILTSNYGAQYPSAGSGTTIVTTKSGGDSYHGELYEFLRNEDFNAKGYFDIGKSAPLYRRNDFGGTIGGPLSIPKLYNAKGKTHFFFSEEARIETSPTAFRQAVPSLAERNGDFSDVCPSVPTGSLTGFSRAQYPDCPDSALGGGEGGAATFINNQINYPDNASSIDPNAQLILNSGIIPLPNATSGCNSSGSACYNADVSLPTYWREELFRIDQTINNSWQAAFRYIHDEWDETTPVPQYAFTQNSFPTIENRFYGPGRSLVARLTGAFSPTFLNEFVVSYTDSYLTLADRPGSASVNLCRPVGLGGPCPVDTNLMGTLSTIFNNNGAGVDGVPKLPGLSIAGNNAEYGGLGFAVDPGYMPWEHSNPIYSFADNLTKTLGRHTLSFGAQFVLYQRNQTNGPIGASTGDAQGLVTFSNLRSTGTTGNSFADFLYEVATTLNPPVNAISSFEQDSAQARYRQRYKIAEPYLQDDFKVSPRLTLNAGLRLSLFGNFHEANNQAYNWEASAFSAAEAATVSVDPVHSYLKDNSTGMPITINPSNPSVGLDARIINGIVRCGTGNRPASCMTSHLLNPSPRVGLAWDPQGNGKTDIRAGYGIFFEHGTADEANTGSLEGAAPTVLDMTNYNPANWASIGGGDAYPLNVTAIPTRQIWPYVQQWSLSAERELPLNTLATFAYVGSRGTHLATEREINQLVPTTAAQNPFGAHEPLLAKGANPITNKANTGGFVGGGDCVQTQLGDATAPSGPFYLANGTQVQPGSQVYTDLTAACAQSQGQNANYLRTFAPGIGEIYSLEDIASSNYNAFQATVRRVSGPLTLGLAYTYSHSLDDASDRSDATFVNSFDISSNKASSNFDERQLLHVSYIYSLPLISFLDQVLHFDDSDPDNVVANSPGHSYSASEWANSQIVKGLFGNWQISGLTAYETGTPFTVVNNGSPTGIGTLDNAGVANGVGSGSYPDLSGISAHSRLPAGGNNSKSFGPLLLNPAAFVAPRGLTFGNAGRNSLNNPSRWNWDTALLKQITLPHETNLEFRAEAFNVFNNTQFRIYDATLGNQAQNEVSCYGGNTAYYSAAGGDGTDCLTGSSFLHPVDAHRPRTIQFALKFAF